MCLLLMENAKIYSYKSKNPKLYAQFIKGKVCCYINIIRHIHKEWTRHKISQSFSWCWYAVFHQLNSCKYAWNSLAKLFNRIHTIWLCSVEYVASNVSKTQQNWRFFVLQILTIRTPQVWNWHQYMQKYVQWNKTFLVLHVELLW